MNTIMRLGLKCRALSSHVYPTCHSILSLTTLQNTLLLRSPVTELAVEHPSNVSLICVKSSNRESPSISLDKKDIEKAPRNYLRAYDVQLASQYRKDLQSYQRKLKWYDPKIISSIDRITEEIYKQLTAEVTSEINIDNIISNLIQLEMRK